MNKEKCTFCKGKGKIQDYRYKLTFDDGLQENITTCLICRGTGLRSEQESF